MSDSRAWKLRCNPSGCRNRMAPEGDVVGHEAAEGDSGGVRDHGHSDPPEPFPRTAKATATSAAVAIRPFPARGTILSPPIWR